MASHIPHLACLAAAVALAGCYESTKPLSPPSGAAPLDATVLGAWICVPDPPLRPQDKATLSVHRVGSDTYDATWVEGDKTSRYRAHGSMIDSTLVINALEVAPHAKWFFLRYKREGTKLRLSLAQDSEIKGGYEARKMDDLRARAGSDELFKVVALCTKTK